MDDIIGGYVVQSLYIASAMKVFVFYFELFLLASLLLFTFDLVFPPFPRLPLGGVIGYSSGDGVGGDTVFRRYQ